MSFSLIPAARSGNAARLLELLQRGQAQVNAADGTFGRTALMCSAAEGYEHCAAILVKAGAAVDLPDKHGKTALILAAEYGHARVAGLLLRAKAAVNARDQNGMTALMTAAKHGHDEALSVLIAAGAKLEVATEEGSTALALAARQLKPAPGRNRSGVARSSGDGHVMCVELLLAAGANPNAVARYGVGALAWATAAAVDGDTSTLRLLLLAGADPLLQRAVDGVPLQEWAALAGRVEAAGLLAAAAAGEPHASVLRIVPHERALRIIAAAAWTKRSPLVALRTRLLS